MIKIKNWKDFQHFKDRNPPWIKLHKKILEQRDIMMISDCSFRILIGLWILASEDENKDGVLPSIEDIAFRLRRSTNEINEALQELKPFLIISDIKTISERYQGDIPETETYSKETEKETEKEYIDGFENFWKIYGRIGDKQKALKAWNKIKKGVAYEEIINGHTRYAEYCSRTEWYNKQHCSTWLNNKSWESEWTVQVFESKQERRSRESKEAAVRGMLRAENPNF